MPVKSGVSRAGLHFVLTVFGKCSVKIGESR